MTPGIIFGTATFGMDKTQFQDKASISSLLQSLQNAGVRRLDSGARYPPLNPGRAEQLIGECTEDSAHFLVDTKVFTDTKTDGSGDLTAEAIEKSVGGSLSRLQRASQGVNVLHIHRADPSTPIREQVHAFNDQIRKGHCRAWGMSNVPIQALEEIFRVCEAENLQKPVCYQGDYNIITRGAEVELLPLLRKHGVAFNAFRPLASGFMTGRYVKGEQAGTRFGDDNPLGKFAQKLFGAEDLHATMKTFDERCAAEGVTTLEAAIRWIAHHSALGDADGIVLGASSKKQVEETIAFLGKGKLSASLVQAADDIWNAVKQSRGSIV